MTLSRLDKIPIRHQHDNNNNDDDDKYVHSSFLSPRCSRNVRLSHVFLRSMSFSANTLQILLGSILIRHHRHPARIFPVYSHLIIPIRNQPLHLYFTVLSRIWTKRLMSCFPIEEPSMTRMPMTYIPYNGREGMLANYQHHTGITSTPAGSPRLIPGL